MGRGVGFVTYFVTVQVKYYSGEDFEVERLDDAIKDYQVKSCPHALFFFLISSILPFERFDD